MTLPLTVDLTPKGKIVFKRPKFGTKAYIENVEYFIQIIPDCNGVTIQYYGEDDNYFDNDQIAEVLNYVIEKGL